MVNPTMKSLRQVIDTLEAIADSHHLIRRFEFGPLMEADISKESPDLYPFLHVLPVSSTYQKGQRTRSISILVADYQRKDREALKDIWSDTEEILADVVKEFAQSSSGEGSAEVFFTTTEVSFDPFQERFDNILAGWECIIDIITPDDNSLCLVPKA